MKYDFIIKENEKKVIVSDKDLKILAKKDSKVDVISLNSSSKKEAFVEENAEVNFYEISLGNNNSEITSYLNGRNSRTNSYSLFFEVDDKEVNINVNAIHKNKETKSNLVCKGILDGRSKLNYSGKIKMEKGAKNSEGYQKQDTLLLSEEACANSIPELEILENDVKCSHGVTLSEINKDQLFYLMSRGINEKEAKKQIIKGFFEPLISKIDLEKIKTEVRNIVEARI